MDALGICVSTPRTIPTIPEEEEPLLRGEHRSELSLKELVGMYAFSFGYGLTLTTYALITFPAEAVRFFPEGHDFALAAFLVLAGIAQLCGPAVGFFSDRCTVIYGKRRPYLVVFGLLLLPCLGIQWYVSSLHPSAISILWYYFASFIGMICLCSMQTVVLGFTPDLVPKHQTGKANGVLVSLFGIGAGVGFFVVIMFPDTELYLTYTAVMIVTTVTTLLHTSGDRPCEERRFWNWNQLASCYLVDRREFPDYFWLFVSRALYQAGASTQSFLQYYFRDWVQFHDGTSLGPSAARSYTANAAFLAQLGLAVTALPSGYLSDSIGRKRILRLCSFGIATCFVLNTLFRSVYAVLVVSFFYGTCNGAILTVSYALAVDRLPSRGSGAQWLAVWDVSAFVGSTIGPIIYSPMLFFLPTRVDMGDYVSNSDSGYESIMYLGSIFVLLSTLVLEKVSECERDRTLCFEL